MDTEDLELVLETRRYVGTIETLLGLMFARMPRDDAQAIIAELRRIADLSRGDAGFEMAETQSLERLAGELQKWAETDRLRAKEPGSGSTNS